MSRLFADSLDSCTIPAKWELFWKQRNAQDLLKIKQLAQLLRARIDNHLRASAATSALSLALLKQFFTVENLERFESDIEREYEANGAKQPDYGQALLADTPKSGGAARTRTLLVVANVFKLVMGASFAIATDGLGFWDLVFFPLGALTGAYGIAFVNFGLLRQHRQRFRDRREADFRQVVTSVFTGPLMSLVEKVASEEDMEVLQAHCRAIDELEL
jgi:hypothetical protein